MQARWRGGGQDVASRTVAVSSKAGFHITESCCSVTFTGVADLMADRCGFTLLLARPIAGTPIMLVEAHFALSIKLCR